MHKALYEYAIPSQVYFIDPDRWPSLQFRVKGHQVSVLKPISDQVSCPLPRAIQQRPLFVSYSLIQVEVVLNDQEEPLAGVQLYDVVEACLGTIRVMARQYWLPYRGSGQVRFDGLLVESKEDEQTVTGFGSIRPLVYCVPLSLEIWLDVGTAIQRGEQPRTAEVFLCDSLVRASEGDLTQAIAMLGVAVDLELASFIHDLRRQADKKVVSECRKKYRKPSFSVKLGKVTETLGAIPLSQSDQRTVDIICELRELRGMAVHEGTCQIKVNGHLIPADRGHFAKFVFAVEKFLRWTAEERSRLGIGNAAPLHAVPRFFV